MFTKLIAPVLVGGALLGSVAVGGTAFAATPATPAPAAHAAAHPAHAATHAGRAWLKAHRRALRRSVVVISASTIGVTPEALVTELRSGTSIAQVAGQHDVSASTVESALVTAADAEVAKAVTAHELTQAQADRITAALPARITKVVDRVR
jgi:hypothetical protein